MLFLVTLKENLLLFKTPFLLDTLTPTTGYSEIPQRPTLKVTMLGLMGDALYFWDETSHTFHTPYGMITPTLLDVAVITGLPLLGEKILTTIRSTIGVEYAIGISSTTYQSFILNNKGEDDQRIAVYMPNAVSKQFGLAQAIPSCYHLQEPQSLHVISQHNKGKNENTSSSDKSVSKFSSEDDVDAFSPSGQLASQVIVAPTISLIVPSTENLMAVTSNKPTPIANANKTPNVVKDLLAGLESINEAYECSMDTQKAVVESCSTIQSYLLTEQLHTTPPTTKIINNSILLPLAQQLNVILSKPVLTLATDPHFKAQLFDILQTFSITPHPKTIDPLLAHLQKVYEDLYIKFSDSQAAISSYQESTEALSKLKQDTSSFETAKTTLAVHIAKAKDQDHELSEEIRDLEQQLTVKRGVKNRLDSALIKNEGQFVKASSMLDSSNAALQSLEEKMLSSQEATKEAKNFQTTLQTEVTRLKEIFET
ncbi:uncharacterized protein DS421_3g91690 [Arachis hypogaea]|nr:uncharacterized protein DS421_3g91690 [Arachis hypogaea]